MRWPAYRSGFGVFQDVEQIATLDVEGDVLEPDASSPADEVEANYATFTSGQTKNHPVTFAEYLGT